MPDYLRPVVVPFVRECVADAGHASLRETRRRLTACAALAEYSLNQHLVLDPELVFDPVNIESFTEWALQSEPSAAASYRAALRRMGPILTREAPWPAEAPRVPGVSLSAPYTNRERAALIRASRRQSTPVKARVFQATLGLGLGCGLDGRWIPKIQVRHLRSVGSYLCVDVCAPAPRLVPVTKEQQVTLLHLVDGLPRNHYLLTGTREPHSKNYLSESLAELDIPRGTPALHGGRIRSTWLLRHLILGTRLDILALGAGLKGTASFADLFPHIPPIPRGEMLKTLVGR